ncbi:MAG TPA: GSCFA domain-containing protein [Bacteroidales bacterium]|nr:GSCFA domain-containing protein [Bacteroidales bacterium]HOM39738.1 GSCFA domain-containing protein [Bacteroidales bacterium]
MNLRTTFNIEPGEKKITYHTGVMFTGSCFAMEIGSKMAEAKMKVMINPYGTIYNPVSIASTLDMIMSGRVFTKNDLFYYDNLYHSFYHYTNFSSVDPDHAIEKINDSNAKAHDFLKQAQFLFVTFGTARVYKLKEGGMVVSNCHKLPSTMFSNELLEVEGICELWEKLLDRIAAFNPELSVIFTVSPVRYLKEGAHGNQVSKSILFLAIEKLLGHKISPGYFPAYELLMDDLRDYRFYAADMIHPSETAIDYIFNSFMDAFFEKETFSIFNEAMEIVKARNHRFISTNPAAVKDFAARTLRKISQFEKRVPEADFSEEKKYFNLLIEG